MPQKEIEKIYLESDAIPKLISLTPGSQREGNHKRPTIKWSCQSEDEIFQWKWWVTLDILKK
jgi:hypothetical protein